MAFPSIFRMVYLRYSLAPLFLCLCLASTTRAQSVNLPDAPDPSPNLLIATTTSPAPEASSSSSTSSSTDYPDPSGFSFYPSGYPSQTPNQTTQNNHGEPTHQNRLAGVPLDANGKPIPLNRQQPHRILGFMPNFRTVAAGAAVHPPGWKYNFTVANHQALDYSTFIFLGLTSLTAEAMNSHPALGKGADGFYAYTWRGFLDKTDGTYLSAWLLPSLLHEDTRYYPLGSGHSILSRSLYVISREAVAKTYNGNDTPNLAGLGGKVLGQYISTFYYPANSEDFGVLATKFGYSVMRDVGFSAIREFYPDIAAHYIRKHREKVARQAAHDAQSSKTPNP
jgi:hypothetical protein